MTGMVRTLFLGMVAMLPIKVLVALPLCADRSHSSVCSDDDSYCGNWNIQRREWTPLDCEYRKVTTEQANKCLTNKTLSFYGDSQIRDFAISMMSVLFGIDVEQAGDLKFEKNAWDEFADEITFPEWAGRKYGAWPGLLLPKEEIRGDDQTWQIQIWRMYEVELTQLYGKEILESQMVGKGVTSGSIRRADLNFWNQGMHNQDLWNSTPHGEAYWYHFVEPWLELRATPLATPSVWFPMNPHCTALIPPIYQYQSPLVTIANDYVKQRMRRERLPYFDAASALRSPQRCQVSADGLHVKQWVDLVRARMLLDYLCDEDWNWRGGVDAFISS